MAAKVPLNKFRNVFKTVRAVNEDVDNTITEVYKAKDERATIVIQAQATNPTDTEQTVYLRVSSFSYAANGGTERYEQFKIAENVLFPPFDTKALITGRLVLTGNDGDELINPDALLFGASNEKVVLCLGLLETKNTN